MKRVIPEPAAMAEAREWEVQGEVPRAEATQVETPNALAPPGSEPERAQVPVAAAVRRPGPEWVPRTKGRVL
jgi:hypothetical protein